MNTTNRGLNRAIIFIIGLLLLIIGAATIVLAVVPSVTSAWKSNAPTVSKNVDGAFAAAPLLTTGASWLAVAALALLLLLVILLLVFIIRQGNGHTSELFSDQTTEHGSTIVKSTVAKDALEQALADRDDIVAANVSTYDVNGTNVLKVSATARRGVSPKDVANTIESALTALDLLLGFQVPALIQISGGLRARAAKTTRLQ
ncbi:hypothetical protein [Curtobacterium sp. SL109]|uniref:hypothetical protein n=1 Tax=Curtobacterium sp. SL109 TaxID=2994662 RepID=UPI0022736875|nr:hypothetical protein [Curtobacterium sp. SL109]MCY1693010.1 hypothetical protein [Curtobacterium sp. SL109]